MTRKPSRVRRKKGDDEVLRLAFGGNVQAWDSLAYRITLLILWLCPTLLVQLTDQANDLRIFSDLSDFGGDFSDEIGGFIHGLPCDYPITQDGISDFIKRIEISNRKDATFLSAIRTIFC